MALLGSLLLAKGAVRLRVRTAIEVGVIVLHLLVSISLPNDIGHLGG